MEDQATFSSVRRACELAHDRTGVDAEALHASVLRIAAELEAAYVTARRAHQPVDPEAERVLDDLGRDHSLALVTNGAPDVQREKLAGTTLAPRFGAIVISAELGIAKPDPRIFAYALRAIGAERESAVGIGDSRTR